MRTRCLVFACFVGGAVCLASSNLSAQSVEGQSVDTVSPELAARVDRIAAQVLEVGLHACLRAGSA